MKIASGIWVVENFFTPSECLGWIEFAESLGFEDAPISTGVGKEEVYKDIRNNNRAMVDDEDRAFLLWKEQKNMCQK